MQSVPNEVGILFWKASSQKGLKEK